MCDLGINVTADLAIDAQHKTMHDIFRFFRSKKCVSVVTCKVRRAFSIEGSFNKIHKFIFKL